MTVTCTVHGSRVAVQRAVKGGGGGQFKKKNDFQRSTNFKLFTPTEGNSVNFCAFLNVSVTSGQFNYSPRARTIMFPSPRLMLRSLYPLASSFVICTVSGLVEPNYAPKLIRQTTLTPLIRGCHYCPLFPLDGTIDNQYDGFQPRV